MILLKALRSLYKRFICITLGYPTAEEEKLVQSVTESSTKVTEHGLGGYRVHSPIDDPENLEKELDLARDVVENQPKLSEKDEVFRDSLLVLLKSVEVKTIKIDKLITELEKLK